MQQLFIIFVSRNKVLLIFLLPLPFKAELPTNSLPTYKIQYRDYKISIKQVCKKHFEQISTLNEETIEIDEFKQLLINLLNTYSPLKTKFLKANHANVVTKEVTKAVILRSNLRNKHPSEKSVDTWLKYIKTNKKLCLLIEKD